MRTTIPRRRAGARAPTRRHRERAAREADVLDAAERVIERRQGFDAASMVEIAREAELALGTVYSLFPSKEEIFQRLLVTRAAEFTAGFRAALTGPGTPRERLEAGVRWKIDFCVRHREFVRHSAPASPYDRERERVPDGVRALRQGNLEAVARVFTEARRAGSLRTNAVPRELATAYQAVSTAFCVNAALDPDVRRLARVHAAVAGTFLDAHFKARA